MKQGMNSFPGIQALAFHWGLKEEMIGYFPEMGLHPLRVISLHLPRSDHHVPVIEVRLPLYPFQAQRLLFTFI